MQLHELPSIKNSKRKRVGRGPGSNWGQTCGKGQKGQKSRAGYSSKRGFEGGQMAISRRLPKFGFKPLNKVISRPLNLAFLESNERIRWRCRSRGIAKYCESRDIWCIN